MQELVARYIKEIEKLKAKLIESEQMYQQLKKVVSATRKNIISFADSDGLFYRIAFHASHIKIE